MEIKTPDQMIFGEFDANPMLENIRLRVSRKREWQGGSTRRFVGLLPGGVLISQKVTAITSGFQFKWIPIGGNVKSYNIYKGTVNNGAVASFVQSVEQPPVINSFSPITWQETTTGTPYYWVAAVTPAGREGPRILMNAAPAPVPQPNEVVPPDPGTSGGGGGSSSGGTRPRGFGGRYQL